MKLFLVLIVLLSVSQSADDGDWVDPFKLNIDFVVHPYFAGYLNISSTQAYYYSYFPSQGNPLQDPLIVRISAGPACSSLYSAFYSKGPFTFVKGTKGFRVNPYNWNKNANILFIEGPGEVGFSIGNMTTYNDNIVAELHYAAIQKFYLKFPELKDQIMYLTGEQYAGIIVPRIAEIIISLNRNPNTPAWMKIKFGGFLLNNPCTQGDECQTTKDFSKFTIEYLKNHYFISEEVYNSYKEKCLQPYTPECQTLLHSIQSSFLNTGSDIKNIYQPCIQQEGDIPCVDLVGLNSFLNNPDIKKEIHADQTKQWKFCNPDVQSKWVKDPKGSIEIYKKILRQHSREQHDLRIWIISGALSGNVPITGTKRWFEELKRTMGLATTRMWEPWWYNTVNAGNIEEVRGMSLITVRSGGYLLWNDQPEIAYHIVDSFIKGMPL